MAVDISQWGGAITLDNGKVFSMGGNMSGQLGVGFKNDGTSSGFGSVAVPTQTIGLPEGQKIKAFAPSADDNLVLMESGDVWAWGRGNYGALGNGHDSDRDTATNIQIPGNLISSVSIDSAEGGAKVGDKLTATAKAVSAATSFSYQWLRNGVAIVGATGESYTTTDADFKRKITVTMKGVALNWTPSPAVTSSPVDVVGSKVKILTDSLPDAVVGEAYSATIEIDLGYPASTGQKLVSGALPKGLEFDPATNIVSGTPTEVEKAEFQMQLTNSLPSSDEKLFTINVTALPVKPPTTTPPTTTPVTPGEVQTDAPTILGLPVTGFGLASALGVIALLIGGGTFMQIRRKNAAQES